MPGGLSRRLWGMGRREEPGRLIVHGSHHRAGTVLFNSVFHELTNHFPLKYQSCPQEKLEEDTDIWMEVHSRMDLDALDRPYVGTHIIRDPREMWVSAYFYHQRSMEAWLHVPRQDLGGRTYQQSIRALDRHEGLLFELNLSLRWNLNNMERWNYGNPHVLEIRYEDLVSDYTESFRKIFSFYGFRKTNRALKAAEKHNVNGMSSRRFEQYAASVRDQSPGHIHSIHRPGRWREVLSPEHIRAFKEQFGDLLIRLGYETGYDW
jgi:hypothetical protein